MKNREEYTELTELELEEKYSHYKEELFNLRFQAVTGQLANPSRIQTVKHNIARILTQLSAMQKARIKTGLKEEFDTMLKEKNVDPMKVPLREKLGLLKERLAWKARKLNQSIRSEVDFKVEELVKALRGKISEKLRNEKGEKQAQLRASSKRLRDPKFTVRKKFLDKLSSMGLNEASQIASLKETKRAKLNELSRIRTLQRELATGKLPF